MLLVRSVAPYKNSGFVLAAQKTLGQTEPIEAADRIFNLLPEDQAVYFRALWDEFEARQTAESRFAAAMDRLQPLLHNYHTKGGTWKEHKVHKDQVIKRNHPIAFGSKTLWDFAAGLIDDAVDKGYLEDA